MDHLPKTSGRRKLSSGLTPRQEVFVKAYTDPDSPTKLNGLQSAKVAYNSTTQLSAQTTASMTLKKPAVKKAIQDILEDMDLKEKVSSNLNRLIEAAGLAPADDMRAQTLGLKAVELLKEALGLKGPDRHLHVTLTPEDRDKEYEAIANLVQKKQQLRSTEPSDAT